MAIQKKALRILQVSQNDSFGGAQMIARNLHQHYLDLGHDALMAVGTKWTGDERVYPLLDDRSGTRSRLRVSTTDRIKRKLSQKFHKLRGLEQYRFPKSAYEFNRLLDGVDVVHAHNLHRNYFHLECLAMASRRCHVVLTLHDAWLFSGHCAHSLGCDRWKTGCGSCPDLSIYPPIARDGTAENWQRKMSILRSAEFFVATPAQWLADQVPASGFAESVCETRVIRNGIDLQTFQPGEQRAARLRLGLPLDKKIILFVAEQPSNNSFKDIQLLLDALKRLDSPSASSKHLCLALGQRSAAISSSIERIVFVQYQSDPQVVADYYRASDLYVHPARGETYPTVILEAQACGLPVVATNVGGIPEQIEDGQTGVLVSPGSASEMAAALDRLLSNHVLATKIGCRAASKAQREYSMLAANSAYSDWIEQIVGMKSVRTRAA